MLGALLLTGCAALVQWRVVPGAEHTPAPVGRRRLPLRTVALAAAGVVVGAAHEAFLAAVLPNILPALGVRPTSMVEVGGLLVFLSGAAAALGGLAAPRLLEEIPHRRLLPLFLVGSSVGLIAFSVAGSVWVYAALRLLQALCIAPLFPVVVIRMARHGGGETIGLLNAARSGGNFLGPVVATSLLASGAPALVYIGLGLMGLAVVPLLEGVPGHHRPHSLKG